MSTLQPPKDTAQRPALRPVQRPVAESSELLNDDERQALYELELEEEEEENNRAYTAAASVATNGYQHSDNYTTTSSPNDTVAILAGPSLSGLTSGAEALSCQAQDARKERFNRHACFGVHKQNLLLQDLKRHLIYLLLGLGGLALGFTALSGLIAHSMRSTVVPYVVTVDKHGVVLNEGTLPSLSSNQDLPASVITSQLCEFVRNVRLITKDNEIQHQAILQAYAFVLPNSELAQELSTYYRNHNPFTLAQKQTVTIEIANVINVGEHTLQIDWVEHLHSADPLINRQEDQERKLRALLTYSIEDAAQQDTESILLNPLNIYIHTFIVTDVIA